MSAGAGRRPLSLVVTVAEALTLLAVLVFVVMLFANEPPDPAQAVFNDEAADDAAGEVDAGEVDDAGGEGADGGEGGEVIDGAVIYAGACASCHGSDGGGGIGPALAGGAVVEAFPDIADQITIVTEGDGGMPGFSSSLSPEEIEAVVLHTRENL